MSGRLSAFVVIPVLCALVAGCASTGGASGSGARTSTSDARPRSADASAAARGSALKVEDDVIPSEVRAIEAQIDKRAAIMADEILIEASRNYEWDVSLAGDAVTPQKKNGAGQASEAVGSARATFRNLELRASKRIVFWKSGFDVAPFIRITARGAVVYAEPDPAGGPARLRRADCCVIRNADLAFDADAALPVAARDAATTSSTR